MAGAYERGDAIRWLPCRNSSSVEEIPPRSLVRVVDTDEDQVLEVAQPDEDGQYCYVTSGEPIAPDGLGMCTADDPITIAYDDAETPAEGEEWGAESGSYLAVQGQTGWVVHGDVAEDEDGLKTFYARREVIQQTVTYVTESGNAAPRLTDNAGFCIHTRGTSLSIATNGFGPDRWYVETETDGVTYDEITDPYTGACCAARFTKHTATGKFLIAQWLKSCPYVFYRNREFHIQFALKGSIAVPLKVGFFVWNGTADSIPVPSVSSWNADFAIPTWSAGVLSATSSVTAGTVSHEYWTVNNGSLFSFDNLGFLIYTDEQVDPGDWIELAEAFLAPGAAFTTPYPTRWELDEYACTQYGLMGGAFN